MFIEEPLELGWLGVFKEDDFLRWDISEADFL